LARELKQAAQQCDADPQIKVVILSASGRFFCAGGDLKEMLSHGDEIGAAAQALADDFHAAISTLSRMQAVLIIAVQGQRDIRAAGHTRFSTEPWGTLEQVQGTGALFF